MAVSHGRAVGVIEAPDGQERVLIVQRSDGRFTYRRQWSIDTVTDDPDSAIGASNVAHDPQGRWGPPGPDCGIYPSAVEAETEAMQRVGLLRAGFH